MHGEISQFVKNAWTVFSLQRYKTHNGDCLDKWLYRPSKSILFFWGNSHESDNFSWLVPWKTRTKSHLEVDQGKTCSIFWPVSNQNICHFFRREKEKCIRIVKPIVQAPEQKVAINPTLKSPLANRFEIAFKHIARLLSTWQAWATEYYQKIFRKY